MALIDDMVHQPDMTGKPSAGCSPDDDMLDSMDDGEAVGDSIEILGNLLTHNEKFRRKINERHLEQDLQQVCAEGITLCSLEAKGMRYSAEAVPKKLRFHMQVEMAGERLQAALSDAWDIVRIPQRPESPKQRASLVHDRVNNVSHGLSGALMSHLALHVVPDSALCTGGVDQPEGEERGSARFWSSLLSVISRAAQER